jgi:dihydropyrimidinase
MDLIVRNGTVVTVSAVVRADVGVLEGRIVAIDERLTGPATNEIDASGCYVLPGSIDPHTHIQEPFMGTTTNDDWYEGTAAAAAGGVTTVVDFAYQEAGGSLSDAVARWHANATGMAIVDYGFHVVIADPHASAIREIPMLVAAGYPTFKLFMCYEGLAVSDRDLMRVFDAAAMSEALPLIHAENDGAIRHFIALATAAGETHPRWVARTRPVWAEAEAVHRVIKLAAGRVPLYIVHMSSGDAVDTLAEARADGVRVTGETCPHYLTLTVDLLEQDQWDLAARYTCAPPLRDSSNHERLWSHLRLGNLATIGSDHDCFTLQVKAELGRDAFAKIPLGIPGIETRLPVMFSEGVAKERLSLQTFVAAMATNPARLMGLYPQKGTIAIGADADLVVVDPEARVTITASRLHQASDFTPFEGWQVLGYPRVTISRGDIVFIDGQILGRPGRGRFEKRGKSSLYET